MTISPIENGIVLDHITAGKGKFLLEGNLALLFEDHNCIGILSKLKFQSVFITMHRTVKVSKHRDSYTADGIPELRKFFGFGRLKPSEVGLIVGINTRHKFGVCAVGIGEGIFPSF